jgi:nitrous oxidase accessory protein
MKKFVLLAFVLVLLSMMTIAYASNVLAWSNGGYSDDPSNPDYGTHDWIAEHALDWLPEEEKLYIMDNLAAYLYGTELPDNGMAPDGIGDTVKHHIYYWSNESLQDDASAFRADEEYNNTLAFLELGDLTNASKTAGIMSHYIVDMAVFGHVMGSGTDWGAENHHSDYETYVNQRTDSYDDAFNTYLSFDGELTIVSASDAAIELAYDTTFDVDGDLTCVWMDQNYNWSDPIFKDRCGESLNLAVNYLTDVLHTLYLEVAPVHNIDSGKSFSTIQGAINDNETLDGHTIFVEEGIYCENLVVNKSLSLIGKDRNSTIIYGNNSAYLVNVEASNVKITGFTLQGWTFANIYINVATNVIVKGNRILFIGTGIELDNSNNNVIIDNIIEGYGLDNIGILVVESSGCIIENNTISGAVYDGIRLIWSADANTIRSNTISNNDYGIHIIHSNINTIINNTIVDNSRGIFMENGDENTVVGNTLSSNWNGISLTWSSYDNIIYHNDFISNTQQIGHPLHSDPLSSNRWDNGLEGNYWSDYEGRDANLDGIGDTPYIIDGDNYPLMGMFSDFNATSEYHVQTVCNSTISDFQFNGTAISFDVTGEDATTGFCRLCIPRALINETYKVFANGTEVPHTLLPCSNSTHSYLYFTYNHSTQKVVIIPEFPTWTSMLLILIVLTVMVAIYKRRLLKTPIH